MKILKENVEYQGSPEEIAEFFALTELRANGLFTEEPLPTDPYAPFEDVISDSEKLRQTLAKDPLYNPFPGISKSPESEDAINNIVSSAELDTGVERVG